MGSQPNVGWTRSCFRAFNVDKRLGCLVPTELVEPAIIAERKKQRVARTTFKWARRTEETHRSRLFFPETFWAKKSKSSPPEEGKAACEKYDITTYLSTSSAPDPSTLGLPSTYFLGILWLYSSL